MIFRTGVIALLITLCFSGCSTKKPEVWKDQDVSLSNFTAFEIQPVFNATGKPVKQDVMAFLTFYLKAEFKAQNLQLSDTPQTKSGVLLVQSDILIYEVSMPLKGYATAWDAGGVAKKAQCRLRTRLLDKSTNKVVGAILTDREVGVGIIGHETNEWVLKVSAAAVAKEVAKMMQPM